MSTLETIQVEWDGRVAVVALSRPKALNALNTQLMLEVGSDLKSSGNDSSQIALSSPAESSIPTTRRAGVVGADAKGYRTTA
jgi:hypothetical protein